MLPSADRLFRSGKHFALESTAKTMREEANEIPIDTENKPA
jgi:hypothetical protein